jgi:hypothetical protein
MGNGKAREAIRIEHPRRITYNKIYGKRISTYQNNEQEKLRMKMLKVAAALVAVSAAIFLLWFLIFGRVPFDGDASSVAESNVHEELVAVLSQESFHTAPDTLYYSVTNNGGTPVGVFRHASIERLVDGEWRVLKMNLKNSNIADSDDMWYCSEIKPRETYSNWIFLKAYGNMFKRGEYRLVVELFPYTEGSINGFTEHVCSEGCEHIYMTAGFKVK